MIVKICNEEEVQEVVIKRMTDISTAMFAIMQVFEAQVRIDELIDENVKLQEKVEELEEYKYGVERTLEDSNYDNVSELRDAYDEASDTLSNIADMVRGY